MPKKNLKYLLPLLSLLLLVFFSYHPLLLKAENTLAFCTSECEEEFLQEYNRYPSTDEIAECITECQQIPNAGGAGITFENPLGPTNTLGELVNHILAFALKLAIPIATIMIVWSGFLFATSAGNEEKIKTAQRTLIWAIVGLGIAIIATTIPALIKEFLGESPQSETGWECDYTIGECYGGVPNATYSSWQACEVDCNQGYGKISESNLSQNSESLTPPPPNTKALGGFIYQDSCREEKSFNYFKCCIADPTIIDGSFECTNASNIR